jgi:hypothetical protein
VVAVRHREAEHDLSSPRINFTATPHDSNSLWNRAEKSNGGAYQSPPLQSIDIDRSSERWRSYAGIEEEFKDFFFPNYTLPPRRTMKHHCENRG